MPRRVQVQGPLSIADLEEKYRSSTKAVEKERWRVVWLIKRGMTTKEVSDVTAYNVRRVRHIVARYNEHGDQAMIDKRCDNKGRPPRLGASLQAKLDQALSQPPPDGGLWSGPKVARWIEKHTENRAERQLGWDYLQRLGYSLQIPRRCHIKADQAEQDDFKKNSERGSDGSVISTPRQ